MLHVRVSVTMGLGHVMKSPQSQQSTLGDTLPVVPKGINASCRTPHSAPWP